MSAAQSGNYTVTFNSANLKFTWVHNSTTFTIDETTSLAPYLGITVTQSLAISQTSDKAHSLFIPFNIYIRSNAISGGLDTHHQYVDGKLDQNIICIIPKNAPFGEDVIYRQNGPHETYKLTPTKLTYIDLQLCVHTTFETSCPVNDWTITLQFTNDHS
jgi:hypothetical protein